MRKIKRLFMHFSDLMSTEIDPVECTVVEDSTSMYSLYLQNIMNGNTFTDLLNKIVYYFINKDFENQLRNVHSTFYQHV